MRGVNRLFKAITYCWKHSKEIKKEEGSKVSQISVFFDMLYCYLRYNLWSNQYLKEKIYKKNQDEKIKICLYYNKENSIIEQKRLEYIEWGKKYFSDVKFFAKWGLKSEMTASRISARIKSYKKRFNLVGDCFIGYNVSFTTYHFRKGSLVIGEDFRIQNNCLVDYSGGLKIGNNVYISENSRVMTHNHSIDIKAEGKKGDQDFIPTPLNIEDNVWIGARSIILPGVTRLGRCSMVGSGTVIRNEVPPYAIMVGNPAKIVGFIYTPEEVEAIEKENYPENERIDIEKYRKIYDKAFINKAIDIKHFLSNY